MSPLSEDYREISSAVNIYLNWQDYVVVTSGSMLVERNVTEREVSVWYKEIWRSQHRPERLSVISGTDWPDWCFLSSSRHPDLGSQQKREPDKKERTIRLSSKIRKLKSSFPVWGLPWPPPCCLWQRVILSTRYRVDSHHRESPDGSHSASMPRQTLSL